MFYDKKLFNLFVVIYKVTNLVFTRSMSFYSDPSSCLTLNLQFQYIGAGFWVGNNPNLSLMRIRSLECWSVGVNRAKSNLIFLIRYDKNFFLVIKFGDSTWMSAKGRIALGIYFLKSNEKICGNAKLYQFITNINNELLNCTTFNPTNVHLVKQMVWIFRL